MTIERFDFESRDIAKSNVEKIGELFPGVITEKTVSYTHLPLRTGA